MVAASALGLPRWARECVAGAVATALAVIVVGALAAGDRAEVLFRDADSLFPALLVNSLAAGQPQDWALSPAFFIPEVALFAMLRLIAAPLGVGLEGTLAINGVVNLVALYGAMRIASGSARVARAPVAGALLAFGAFALLAITETTAVRDSFQFASMVAFTTYYSATAIGAVAVVGLARRALDRITTGSRMPLPHLLVIGAVAAASVFSNPLFAVWATFPVTVLALGVAFWRRMPHQLWIVVAVVGGSGAGYLLRYTVARWIAPTTAPYAEPDRWRDTIGYLGGLLGDRATAPWGWAGALLVVAMLATGVVATVVLVRRRSTGTAFVAAYAWTAPLLIAVGAVAVGTHAARYLQPFAFASALALTVLPDLVAAPVLRRSSAAIAATTGGVALAVLAGFGVVGLTGEADRPDADLACVVSWVEASGRTGAGQFWTVRLPKTHLSDPRALVQVDHRLNGYAWIVNRDDFTVGEVSFLVLDDQSVPFDLPGGRTLDEAGLVSCGRYTIADFGAGGAVPLGPQRS
ncbi:hypothetical protein AB1K54_15220 [Microbacterium sp. BWT-B31]|uniref:hypothetical protein n=1 Tax=Microbacterium sp. BWT-B31 TaxID=3232072 RepID=UPI00352826B2